MGIFDFFSEESPALVSRAVELVDHMLQDGHEMFAASAAFVLDNEILDVDLHALDEEINEREQLLRRLVLEHLSVNPSRDMVLCLKLLSIVHEAERIGDITKSMARAGQLANKPRMGDLVYPLREMRDRILSMFARAKHGFVKGEREPSRMLMETHQINKNATTDYLTQLAARDDITANEGIVYAITARLMSRVSSHLSNIASSVASPFDQIRRAPNWTND